MTPETNAADAANFAPLPFTQADEPASAVRLGKWRPIEFPGASGPPTERRSADEVIAAAEAQAAAIVSAARREADEARRQAEVLAQSARQEVAALRSLISRVGDEIQREKHELLARIEPQLLALTARMAGKVVRRVIAEDADVVVDVVRDALRRAEDAARVRVLIHPRDRQIIERRGDDLRLTLRPNAALEIVEDESVEPGGCVVRADDMEINADIGHQLAVLQQRLESAAGDAHRTAA
ncbi:MAG: FliH/SctL family protein [Armatimonadota bacterium]